MPRRLLDRDEELRLDLRQGPHSPDCLPWMRRHMSASRLAKPLAQLGARGVWVPPPPARSQGAVVKLWTAKASTTSAHTRYLREGKGRDGADAVLYDRDGQPVDRQAFVQRARDDGHQLRAMVSLEAGDRADLVRFGRRLLRQIEADVQSPIDAMFAVHHDTLHPHLHLVIRGVLPNGETLYLTKHYWAYGLKYRAQTLATAMLGPMPGVSQRTVQVVRQWLLQRAQGKELTHG
jgi:hypothetical protein